MLPKFTTMLITPKSASPILTLPLLRIFLPTTIPLRTTRRARLAVEAIAAARITAAAEIVVVTAVAIVVVADVGAAVADVNEVADARRDRMWVVAICLPPNMLRRKAASLAETILVVTTTVARRTAASEARKIAAARRVDLNRAVPRSAALIIARLKLPHPALPRKNPFFFPANLSPSIVASLRPRPFRLSSNRNLTSRNQKSKKQLRARQVT